MNTDCSNHSVRIAMIDDEEAVCDAIRRLIESDSRLVWTGSYRSLREAIPGLLNRPADVVLLDLRMPETDGIQCIEPILATLPSAEVVMLTLFEEDEDLFKAVCAGATGYLLKRDDPARLLKSLAEIPNGVTPMSPGIARRVLTEFRRRNGNFPQGNLSPQESRILNSLRRGKTYKETAVELNLSVDTVRTYIRRIYKKLRVNSLAEAVYLIQHQ